MTPYLRRVEKVAELWLKVVIFFFEPGSPRSGPSSPTSSSRHTATFQRFQWLEGQQQPQRQRALLRSEGFVAGGRWSNLPFYLLVAALRFSGEIPGEGVVEILELVALRRALTNSDGAWPDPEWSKHRCKPVGRDDVSTLLV